MGEEEYIDYEIGTFHKTGRYLMYIFNAIFFAFASMLFALCIWIRFDPDIDDYVRNINFMHFWDGAIVLMVGAMIVMLAALTGVFATYFWSIKILTVYVVLCAISFVMNLGGSAYMLSIGLESTQAYPYIQEHFRDLIYRYNYEMDAKRTVDIIQEYIGCCGGYSAGDWEEIHMPVPNSCRDQVTGNQFGDSCAEVVSWYLEFRTGWVSGIALCICFLQLFTLVFAICMYRGIREKRAAYEENY